MKRIAIFAEGQTESIFVRELLLRLVDASKMYLECIELKKQKMTEPNFLHKCPNPEIYILVADVHGDEGVISSIRDRGDHFVERTGYDEIIGLRDMYCRAYRRLSPEKIDGRVSREIIGSCYNVIREMRNVSRVQLYFATMEIEAWFLGMYNLFEKVNTVLSADNIKNELNIDLKCLDPQKEFFKPTEIIKDIMGLCRRDYTKKKSEVEAIARRMQVTDFDNAKENNRCGCFGEFCREIEKVAVNCLYSN